MRLLWLFLINTAESFITRLNARKHANFTIQNGKYFNGFQNISGKTLTGISKSDCGLACTFFPSCMFANHKRDNTECHLLTSTQGTMTSDANWRFLTTNYSDGRNIGPTCQSLKPCEPNWQVCQDSDVDPFYTCTQLVNVARKYGQARQSSTNKRDSADKAIDGGLSGYFQNQQLTHTNLEANPWLLITLNQPYQILFIRIFNRVDCCSERLQGFMLRIGLQTTPNNNAFCCYVDQAGITKKDYFCQYGVLTGKYIYLLSVDNSLKYLTVAELEAGALM